MIVFGIIYIKQTKWFMNSVRTLYCIHNTVRYDDKYFNNNSLKDFVIKQY